MNTDTNTTEPLSPWLTTIRQSLLKQPPEIPDEGLLKILAALYWELGRIPESLACVRLMEERDAATYIELSFRGYWELYLGDSKGARDTFAKALQQNEDEFAPRLGYAYALFYLGDYQTAGTFFQRLTDDGAPLNSPPVMAAASRAMAAGKRPAQIIMAPVPGLPPGLAEVMQLKILNGEDGALLEAQQRLSRLPPVAQLPIGRFIVELYLNQDKNEPALNLLEELMKTHETDAPLQFFKGIALRRLGHREESQACFSKAVEFGPLYAQPWGALGAGWMEQQEMQKAVEAYTVATFLDSSDPHFWGDLGTIESLQEQYEKARKSLSKSIELGLANFSNYFNRGACAMKLGEIDAAIRDWHLAIAAEPNHPRVDEVRSLIELDGEADDNRFTFGDI